MGKRKEAPKLSKARLKALWRDVDEDKLTPVGEKYFEEKFLPNFGAAVDVAENDRLHGVRSVSAKTPEEAKKIQEESIYNNLKRWILAGKPGKFIEFMRDRWAPLGAENDPKDLNFNWAPNVRGHLQQNLDPKMLKFWKGQGIVRNPGGASWQV